MKRVPLLVSLIALTAACDSAPSSSIATANMGMQAFGATGPSGAIDVTVTLTTRNPALLEITFIQLDGDDRLFATVGSQSVELAEEFAPVANIYRYTATIDDPDGSELVVALVRPDSSGDAPNSSVDLPSPFEVDPLPANHPRGADLSLSWDVDIAVETSRVLMSGACVAGSEVRFDGDPGQATVPASAFDPGTVDPTDPCTASLQIDHLIDGEVDPAFGRSGRIEAAQTRFVELDVVAE